jgi:RNA polymerase sigma-70 factor (ECF subfamily)
MDTRDSSERTLLSQLARGDEAAWGQVFGAYRDRIYGFCLRMMRNREEAEDASQEVFLRAVRAIGAFRGEASLNTWLHRIARNSCVTRLASARKSLEDVADRSWIADLASDAPGADRSSASAELREALELAIGDLEPAFREVILLREIEDQSYEDIARITETSVATVKTRIYRAREKLKERLAEFR